MKQKLNEPKRFAEQLINHRRKFGKQWGKPGRFIA